MRSTSRTPPHVAVVEAIAAREGVDEAALPPLADAVDPEALNTVVDSFDDTDRVDAHVQFGYCNYTVRITADQTITIE